MDQRGFDNARRELKYQALVRKERLAALDDYIGFWVRSLTGFGAAILGIGNFVAPTVFFHVPHPEFWIGGGLAILAGKRTLSMLINRITGS